MLPDALGPDALRNLSLAGLVLVVLAVVATVRFIHRVVLRLVLVAVLVVVGAALWSQRAELSGCRSTGDCTFFGRDVPIPSRASSS